LPLTKAALFLLLGKLVFNKLKGHKFLALLLGDAYFKSNTALR
jgi:hypothetical protein